MTSNGQETVDEYLQWLGTYHSAQHTLKKLEDELLTYVEKLDAPEHKKAVDGFRRKIIKLRAQIGQAESILSGI